MGAGDDCFGTAALVNLQLPPCVNTSSALRKGPAWGAGLAPASVAAARATWSPAAGGRTPARSSSPERSRFPALGAWGFGTPALPVLPPGARDGHRPEWPARPRLPGPFRGRLPRRRRGLRWTSDPVHHVSRTLNGRCSSWVLLGRSRLVAAPQAGRVVRTPGSEAGGHRLSCGLGEIFPSWCASGPPRSHGRSATDLRSHPGKGYCAR